MPVFKYTIKDGKIERWGCKFNIQDAFGKSRQVKKEGFKLKKEAQSYEREYIDKYQNSSDMSFKSLYEIYIEDKKSRLKESTILTKTSIFKLHILPYFSDLKLSKINVFAFRNWQNELLKKGYSKVYLYQVESEFRIILNYAANVLGIKNDFLKRVDIMGVARNKKDMNILTVDEFEAVIKDGGLDFIHRCLFNLLFWSGMRVGELRALTWGDIDFNDNKINIDKTYIRIECRDIVTAPKTPRSIRKVKCPEWLIQDLDLLKSNLINADLHDRIFIKSIFYIRREFNKALAKVGLKHVRIHDLRHSHASMLINHGVNITAISRRLGHENTQTTLNVYAHLYPNSDNVLIEKLDELKESVSHK